MQNILEALTHYRQANALLKYNKAEELEIVINNLSKILKNKKNRASALLVKQQEKNDKLLVYKEILTTNGINIDELIDLVTNTQKETRSAKYAYTDEDGQSKTWTGQGRTPKFLADKNLKDYLI